MRAASRRTNCPARRATDDELFGGAPGVAVVMPGALKHRGSQQGGNDRSLGAALPTVTSIRIHGFSPERYGLMAFTCPLLPSPVVEAEQQRQERRCIGPATKGEAKGDGLIMGVQFQVAHGYVRGAARSGGCRPCSSGSACTPPDRYATEWPGQPLLIPLHTGDIPCEVQRNDRLTSTTVLSGGGLRNLTTEHHRQRLIEPVTLIRTHPERHVITHQLEGGLDVTSPSQILENELVLNEHTAGS